MNPSDFLSVVESLMLDFADRTGLMTPGKEPRRYLWTDAFAICNFLELYRHTRMDSFLQLAIALVDQVHATLGRHRQDDSRRGWISGLTGKDGLNHPTAGGLRIGKTLPERRPGDPRDERREWDQDGQYFHYLTKWMHALHRMGEVTGNRKFNRFALELAKTAHTRFTYTPPLGGPKRMYWKMSIDLSRPQVHSMGQHDPLDGLVTYYELRGNPPAEDSDADLKTGIDDLTEMCRNQDWTTDDALGIGSLLIDACRLGQLTAGGIVTAHKLLDDIVSSSLESMKSFVQVNPFGLPAGRRLAFREFGFSIGLRAAAKLKRVMTESSDSFDSVSIMRQIDEILRFDGLARTIEDFWLNPANQRADTWMEHRDINEVMLATSLAPEEFLTV